MKSFDELVELLPHSLDEASKQAEDIRRAAYAQVRTIKDDADEVYMASILERAYQEALEYVMCYFDDDDRWCYLEIRSVDFDELESYT